MFTFTHFIADVASLKTIIAKLKHNLLCNL